MLRVIWEKKIAIKDIIRKTDGSTNMNHGFNNSIVVNVKLHDFDHCTMVTSESVIVLRKSTQQDLGGKKLAFSAMYLKLFFMN